MIESTMSFRNLTVVLSNSVNSDQNLVRARRRR